jgi:molybdopterin converting factor small subunit
MAEFKFLGYLAEVAGAQTKQFPLEKPTRLRNILDVSFPEKNVIFLIDQKVGDLDSIIEKDSSVVIMPILSGG